VNVAIGLSALTNVLDPEVIVTPHLYVDRLVLAKERL